MFFDSISDLINMNGHGFYVWLCYGIFAVVIAGNFLSPYLKRKKLLKDLARLARREQS